MGLFAPSPEQVVAEMKNREAEAKARYEADQAKKKQEELQAKAETTINKQYTAATEGAKTMQTQYDTATSAAMEGGPAAAMERQNQAARAEAQRQSDAAIAQAVKGGKTAGMMGGQAALAATGQAANAYGTGMAQGQQQYNQMLGLGAQLGESMTNRLFQGAQGQTNLYGIQQGALTAAQQTAAQQATAQAQLAAQQQAQQQQQQQQTWGNIIGAVGGIAGLFSDRNLKEDIKPAKFGDSLDKIRAYTFRYRGKDRPEAGVMAQDLEKGEMAPAVMDTPEGKMVDTRRLTTMNTAALAEHEKRMKALEKMLKAMGGIE